MAETSKRFNTIELEQRRRILQNWDEDHAINPKNFSKNVLLKKNTLNIRSLKTTEIKFNKLFKDKEQKNNNIEEKNENEKEEKKKGKKMKKGKKTNRKTKKEKLILNTESTKTTQIKRANTSLNANPTSFHEKDKELIDISVNNKNQLTTNPQNI